jgi:hypothetical protein
MRSATAINCPRWVQERAATALEAMDMPDEVAVVDAVCTADHELPTLTTEYSEHHWEQAITDVMTKGRSSLERLIDGPGNQAQFTLEQLKACLAVRVATGGFHRFMLSFVDRPDFLHAMAEGIVHDEKLDILTGQLSSVLNAIHASDAAAFRQRALAAIDARPTQVIHAAANNLRVFTAAEEADIALIRTYGQYTNTVAKLGAIHAITYMGRFTELLPSLKSAVLTIRTEGDKRVAAELADAFGPYGVPLTTLTREEAAAVAAEFVSVTDWDFDQGAITRFLGRVVSLFPDETFALLVERIERNRAARNENRPGLRTFGLVYGHISFMGVPLEKRLELAQIALRRALQPDAGEEDSDLFWEVAGADDGAYDLILYQAQRINHDTLRSSQLC